MEWVAKADRHAKITGQTLRFAGKLDNRAAEVYLNIPEAERRLIRNINVRDVEGAFNNGVLIVAADLLRITSRRLRVWSNADTSLDRIFRHYGWSDVFENRRSPADQMNPSKTMIFTRDEETHPYITRSMVELMRRFECGEDLVKGFEWSLNEILGNVLVHSNSSIGGMVQLTYFKPTKRLNLIVVDAGRGLRNSLRESHLEIADDASAIALAITKGVTRNSQVGQGNGLWGTAEIVKSLGGNLRIWSGNGNLWLDNGILQYSSIPRFHGTVVEWQLPTNNAFSLQNTLNAKFDPFSSLFEKYESTPGEMRFVLENESDNFGNRYVGKKLRLQLLNILKQNRAHRCVVDFRNIRLITSSFADEFLGKLAVVLGEKFSEYIVVDKISQTNASILDMAIRERVAVTAAGQIKRPPS